MGGKKLVVIGFDSISLSVLEEFVRRGALPTVGRLMREGSVTQTWPCFPMETGTNWPALSTGASPWVTGCNMSVHLPGTPLDERRSGFPSRILRAEPLWHTAQRVGKRAVVFDWAQSWPMRLHERMVHVGEDGRPDNAVRALQEVRAYTTHPRQPGPHVTQVHPVPVEEWPGAPEGSLEFELPITPGPQSRYKQVAPLHALLPRGSHGYDRAEIYAVRGGAPLLTTELGQWSPWVQNVFEADNMQAQAGLRAKLLQLAPDGSRVHLYLSEIYPQDDFCWPRRLAPQLVERCGPFIIQASRQQVVQGGASDIATYFQEQEYLAHWWRDAAVTILGEEEWDLFMLKWHGPDWTNHLTMYMIDPRHPMYEEDRAAEGWAMWDRLMGWGDEIIARVLEVAGPDTLVALVSDHGGGTMLPGVTPRPEPNAILEAEGWLVRGGDGRIDWSQTRAYAVAHYVYINLIGRDPQGIVDPQPEEYEALREAIIEALLSTRGEDGQHLYRAVLPIETAGRLGVGGERVGDIFMLPAEAHPLATVDKEAFWATHTREETGTWDWPRLNAGSHLDDSYLVLAGPGVKQGYRRPRPTLITSVAPTLATAWGIPVPAQADGSILWDFLA